MSEARLVTERGPATGVRSFPATRFGKTAGAPGIPLGRPAEAPKRGRRSRSECFMPAVVSIVPPPRPRAIAQHRPNHPASVSGTDGPPRDRDKPSRTDPARSSMAPAMRLHAFPPARAGGPRGACPDVRFPGSSLTSGRVDGADHEPRRPCATGTARRRPMTSMAGLKPASGAGPTTCRGSGRSRS